MPSSEACKRAVLNAKPSAIKSSFALILYKVLPGQSVKMQARPAAVLVASLHAAFV